MKLWDGVKYWIQSQPDIEKLQQHEQVKKDTGETFFKEDLEPVDPKNWCSLNWANDMELKPSQCKLRAQEIKPMLQPYDESPQIEYRNAFNNKRKTLTLEWERPFDPDPEQFGTLNATQLVMDQLYDVKLYYGTFNHDGEENKGKLNGGEHLEIKLRSDMLQRSASQ